MGLFKKGTGQLIAITEIMKSEYYIKILNENLQLGVQSPNLGQWFTFQQDNDLKHMSQISDCMASEKRWQFCHSL